MGNTLSTRSLLMAGALYFVGFYVLSLWWFYVGYFDVKDVFFQADPSSNLESFAHGSGRNAVSHAFIELISTPIRLIEFALGAIFTVDEPKMVREWLALTIAPASSALSAVYFFKTLRFFDIQEFDRVVLTLIFGLCFTNFVFAPIPETFAISCLLLTLLSYYFFACGAGEKKSNTFIWFCLALGLTGITITNICIFFIVYALHLFRHQEKNYFETAKNGCLLCLVAFVCVLIYYFVSYEISGMEKGNEGQINWIGRYFSDSVWRFAGNAANLISAFFHSFFGIAPLTYENEFQNFSLNLLTFYRNTRQYSVLVIAAAVVGVFAYASIRHIKMKKWNELYLLALPILGFNFFFHFVWGREMFLYSQHWITALCLLLVPVLAGKRALSLTILVLIILIDIHFLLNLRETVIIDVLPRTS